MAHQYQIIVIDKHNPFTSFVKSKIPPQIDQLPVEVVSFPDADSFLETIKTNGTHVTVIVVSIHLLDPEVTEALIDRIRQFKYDYQIILVSDQINRDFIRSVVRINAFDLIDKKKEMDRLIESIHLAFRYYINRSKQIERLSSHFSIETKQAPHGASSKRKPGSFHGIVGDSKPIKELIRVIHKAGPSTATCFIQGESGTGKELVANAIYKESKRNKRPYLILNCGAIPSELMESELFGHKRGSFTGAISHREGMIKQADGGTLFLDEITEMPIEMQIKLLRFLQEGTIQPVGGNPEKVNVRILAASNRNPEEAIVEKKLREDLYYRLNVIPINVPPLRDRKEDIPLLVQYYIQLFAEMESREIAGLSDELLALLVIYDWPGNVRELRNMIHRLVIFSESNILHETNLPGELFKEKTTSGETVGESISEKTYIGENFATTGPFAVPQKSDEESETANLSLKDREKKSIIEALKRTNFNKDAAARLLGISRASIYRKIKDYQIPFLKSKKRKGL